MKALHALVFLAACGGGGGNSDAPGIDGGAEDAKVFLDAPPNVPQMIAIGGIASERSISGETVVAGVTMALYATSNETTPIAMATTDAAGKYTIMAMTSGAPIDGFIKATKSGYVDLYMYPATPFISDEMDAGVNMMTPSNKDFLNSLAGGNQMAGKGMIGLQIRDAGGNPVEGATISSTPASGGYRYNNTSGLPSANATATSADGVAFMFNVPSGSGKTFKAHAVIARADKFTTTSIVE
jgi:hypothetical protein